MQRFLTAAIVAVTLTACDSARPTAISDAAGTDAERSATPPTQTVIASGLEYPRGFVFGRDGAIYVAEAGTPWGNETSTVGQCPQVPAPVGPSHGGFTSRVSRITMAGDRTTVVDHLPSARNSFGDVEGAADITVDEHRMYVLIVAGCAHGHANEPSSVLRVRENGSWEMVADLSKWVKAHPTAHPEPDDFEPDGDWYNMAAQGNVLYLVEANQGNLVSVKPESHDIKRIADVSATENGHLVPTGLSIAHDDLLVGELTPFPSVPGSANVIRYERNGRVEERLHGFTAITGVANDGHGNIYVLESFTCSSATPCFPSPGSGTIVRVRHDGTRDIVATGFSFPTALRMGPDHALYVANFSYGPPNMGQIIRVGL